MKRSRKTNRVSWASGPNLCQVRLFLSEDCPSKVGGQVQGHLQKKTKLLLPHSGVKESDDLPPGFEGGQFLNQYKKDLSCIPRIQWKCPPKFAVSNNWRVAVGEESEESKTQKLREMRVLEAVYPRPSSAPSSALVSLDIEDENYDDSLTPIIPLIPIEEEEAVDIQSDLSAPLNTPITSYPPALAQDVLSSGILKSSKCHTRVLDPPASEKPAPGIDLVTAAVTAITKSKEQGSLIDTNLLVKILSNPKMIEKLINGNQAPTITPNPVTIPAIVTAPLPANGNLLHLPSEVHPRSMPMSQIPLSCSKPIMHLPSLRSNGSLDHLPSQSTVTRASIEQGTVSAPGLELAPPIPAPIPDSFKVSAAKPAVGNSYSTPNSVHLPLSTMPALPNTAPISSLKDNSSPIPHLVPTHHVMKPIQPNGSPLTSQAGMKTNSVKDMDYIKNLIRQHGKDNKQEMKKRSNGSHYNDIQNMESTQNVKMRELKPKFLKACMYFKSPKGCRNGFHCPFQHDSSFQYQIGSTLEVPVAKRMKFGGEITGRS